MLRSLSWRQVDLGVPKMPQYRLHFAHIDGFLSGEDNEWIPCRPLSVGEKRESAN